MVDLLSLFVGSLTGLISYKMAKVIYKVYPYYLPSNLQFSARSFPNESIRRVAVISGSTDGLGKAFAKKMYGMNYDLILLGRNEAKIQALMKELR